MATENGWAIASDCGLYVGWHMTRREAIAEHVNMISGRPSGRGWGTLDGEQRAEWRRCQKRGDRAVKVKISYRAQ